MNYDYLKTEKAPKILLQARALIGTKEIIGKIHSDTIMQWADELELDKTYTADEIAWCGLFIAYCAFKAGLDINMTNREALWALNWNKFGTRQKTAMLGDVLTFNRNGGGHVGIYVGNGQFIHAPRTGKPVMVSSLSDGYYLQKFVTARRIFN